MWWTRLRLVESQLAKLPGETQVKIDQATEATEGKIEAAEAKIQGAIADKAAEGDANKNASTIKDLGFALTGIAVAGLGGLTTLIGFVLRS